MGQCRHGPHSQSAGPQALLTPGSGAGRRSVVSVIAYGQRIIGAYEGGRDLGDYLGSIYGGAAAGEWPALLLLTAPLLIAGLWYGVFAFNRAVRSRKVGHQP